MSIVDDLIENLVERNVIQLNGTLTVSLVAGGVKVKGTVLRRSPTRRRTRTFSTSTSRSMPTCRLARSSSRCRRSSRAGWAGKARGAGRRAHVRREHIHRRHRQGCQRDGRPAGRSPGRRHLRDGPRLRDRTHPGAVAALPARARRGAAHAHRAGWTGSRGAERAAGPEAPRHGCAGRVARHPCIRSRSTSPISPSTCRRRPSGSTSCASRRGGS